MYQQFDSEVLYNPTNKFKAMRKLQKGPNTVGKEAKAAPGISEHSKAIKKKKKQVPSKLKEAKAKKEAQNAEASLEEGEEGMIVSEAENSQPSGSYESDDFGFNPTEKKLIDLYDKYPAYLKLTFKKPDQLLDFLTPLNNANKASLKQILNQKSKDWIMDQGFPLNLYIQLVPELKVLTVSAASPLENDLLSTDILLSDLTSFEDIG